ncbi:MULTISPECIES: ribosome silencing factor [Bacillaceae]|uniref:Ribosomal silencing factor RsfS n=1 Tax=Evansella alkalicola TaxID=745819 RepID=A0ABS6JVB8_9BACI|nr:ribosome silencing factor [Litchfieldia alkalitelluris]MBU9722531.1 ribosome silencing factor [Bacillus alkalicola]
MNKNEVLDIAVRAADDKKASDITILNMEGVSLIADYFVICHGNSEKQVEAIAREVKDRAQESGFDLKRLEGIEESRWVLIDLNHVIIHVFHKDERLYYNLEKLWGDAPTMTVEQVLNS